MNQFYLLISQIKQVKSMGSSLQKQYGLVDETYIYHFGKLKIYQDAHGHQYFTQDYSFIVDSTTECEFVEHLKAKNYCPYLMQIKHIEVSRENYCSNTAKITVTFEYIGHTLQQFFDRNHVFSEIEIIKIFHNLLQAVQHLNQNQSYHGDICPQFIYVDNRTHKQIRAQLGDYVVKIFDSAYFQPFLNGYYRAQKEKTYCAPEVLANLGEKRVYPLYNHHIADTFSIGLVILYCMSLVNPLGAYSNKFDIDFYYIESMFRLAERKGYSQKLIGLVRECLQQRNRPNVFDILIKFEHSNLREQTLTTCNKFSLKKSKANNTSVHSR